MTITLSDAALGLAETVCGIALVGAVVIILFGMVTDVIRDSRVEERDARIDGLLSERSTLRLERAAAVEKADRLEAQIDKAAEIFGWEYDEDEEEGS